MLKDEREWVYGNSSDGLKRRDLLIQAPWIWLIGGKRATLISNAGFHYFYQKKGE
jgi:hypothetical protein